VRQGLTDEEIEGRFLNVKGVIYYSDYVLILIQQFRVEYKSIPKSAEGLSQCAQIALLSVRPQPCFAIAPLFVAAFFQGLSEMISLLASFNPPKNRRNP